MLLNYNCCTNCSKILFISTICTCNVHLFKNKKIKKQLSQSITKYLTVFAKSALPKYIATQHIIEFNVTDQEDDLA